MQAPEPAKISLTNSFTDEQLNEAWAEFTESIQQDMPRLYQALKSKLPERITETVLKIKVDSEIQKSEFQEKIAMKLTEYLRTKLENNTVELVLELLESSEAKNLLFSANDKYNYLVELNPDFLLLKQQFNLDIE